MEWKLPSAICQNQLLFPCPVSKVEPSGAPGRRMLCGSPIHCSLLAFVVSTLVLQVPQGHSAPLTVTGPPGPITVAKGEDVVLPCSFSPGQNAQDTEVTWFREQFSPFVHRYKWGQDQFGEQMVQYQGFSPGQNAQDTEVTWFREQFSPFVHRYKLGQDQFGEQMVQYQGRTELGKDGLAKGSADLRIFHVQLSDTGNYTCFVRRGSDYDEAVVELKVTANVVLDPDTAHCDLVLSDNRKRVTRAYTPQHIHYNDKRFNPWRCVLGCEGFTSGRHYWEVEVENAGRWAVGIFRDGVERKREIEFKPEEGIWAVGKRPELKAFTSTSPTEFPEIKAPRRIRVSLDYEMGQVSFFSVDEGIPIFTFPRVSFGGKDIYPWFWLGPGTCLKMCP
ncbi:PREDICTED: butyrophilin subfamily 1 member A1-like [Lepidothrix coronata]|uniref:Butyrophilin subfamily 1 member A1-like n=1 Tax=Lepidothrix coronata TaxID=321398 RepID=A0A6J0J876_9PASS|nr:PREDICTED: butyrophilin subfamily 1 member A1-like [Lepidothrix coronata]